MENELHAIDALLSAALYRAACPPSDQLLLYQAGLLEAADTEAVTAHVQFCTQCRSDLALITAPPEAALGARLAAGLTTARERLRAILAPTPASPAPALRGGPTRTRTYTAGAYQILIALIPAPAPGGLAQIEGQLNGAPIAGGTAELLQGDDLLHNEPIDDLGFFAFDAVSAGAYTLRLSFNDIDIVIEDLEIV
jgi:hypothetical protein